MAELSEFFFFLQQMSAQLQTFQKNVQSSVLQQHYKKE